MAKLSKGDTVEIKRGVHAGRRGVVVETLEATRWGGQPRGRDRVSVDVPGEVRFSLAVTSVKRVQA